MRDKDVNTLENLFAVLFQAHPWHGISPGPHAPDTVSAFIEIVPADGVKFELDKATGHLKLDRPQRYLSMCPTLYGFIPKTYCSTEVGRGCGEETGYDLLDREGVLLKIGAFTARTRF